MKITKYTDENGDVKFDITDISPNGYAAIVAGLEKIDKDGDGVGGVLSCNASGMVLRMEKFERANVDAVKADAAKDAERRGKKPQYFAGERITK